MTDHIGHNQHSTALHLDLHRAADSFCQLSDINCRWELVLQAPVLTNTLYSKYNLILLSRATTSAMTVSTEKKTLFGFCQ